MSGNEKVQLAADVSLGEAHYVDRAVLAVRQAERQPRFTRADFIRRACFQLAEEVLGEERPGPGGAD